MIEVGKTLFGLVLLVGGVFAYRYAYELSRLGERLDSIGSTTPWDEVEPTNWRVLLSQITSVIVAGVGALMVLGGIF
ncbi:hypothetical protein A4G99_13385 [Haladaptatus sp. R4]|uniref:hypothetical protein n=1 Tax=Haladaptatus sp. R4 TaxID=1679489 RepID=UPI0007B4C23A|nr:hypothetical protein [Haladaptatus sp. R4]KZN23834.1 hypothetical protein A4G99_13385 [Haladaptatus sp. R4]